MDYIMSDMDHMDHMDNVQKNIINKLEENKIPYKQLQPNSNLIYIYTMYYQLIINKKNDNTYDIYITNITSGYPLDNLRFICNEDDIEIIINKIKKYIVFNKMEDILHHELIIFQYKKSVNDKIKELTTKIKELEEYLNDL
jgi:hypothetical protein